MAKKTTIETEASVKNGNKRLIFALLAMVLQVLVIVLINVFFIEHVQLFSIATRVIGVFLVLNIYNENRPSAMKLTWMVLLMALPIFGIVFYLLVGFNGHTLTMGRRYKEIDKKLLPLLPTGDEALARFEQVDKRAGNIAHYIRNESSYPVFDDTSITYYSDAADGLEAQKAELRKAKHFIFMEYHAIEDSGSWHGIQDVLVERVQAGVEVRVFYDDMGSIGFVNTDFVDRLEAKGIKAKVFNPFSPGLNLFPNNRDHRKITVIDGLVGFTGGYNLADEYFHVTEPFGHWKDTGIKLVGPAVQNLTVAFLEMWNAASEGDAADKTFDEYFPEVPASKEAQGFIQPYADSPMDNDPIGEDVYISVAEYAEHYAWFVTPYLIITDEMTRAFGLAAQRGVDVRIITPGIPDKKLVYSLTRSYYHNLVCCGVRIFEYTPGFVHAKMSVADDAVATCGTINLDYRSLYHHFENGCLYYGCDAVADTKADFEWMFEQSTEVTQDYVDSAVTKRLGTAVLRLAAPLM
ncbi:MAG: cardiolipin synthase [Atopobiaceae bacterium]|nr:cardiolipin synthase [Atopobiaceae bacterium]